MLGDHAEIDRRGQERLVARFGACQQREILGEALREGGFFDQAHDAEVERVATLDPAPERVTAVRTLVAEEARIGMLVGVAVGLGLGDELAHSSLRPRLRALRPTVASL